MTRLCERCETENREGAAFCKQCGAALAPSAPPAAAVVPTVEPIAFSAPPAAAPLAEPTAPACPACAAPHAAGMRFCRQCGHALTPGAVSAPLAVPTAPTPAPAASPIDPERTLLMPSTPASARRAPSGDATMAAAPAPVVSPRPAALQPTFPEAPRKQSGFLLWLLCLVLLLGMAAALWWFIAGRSSAPEATPTSTPAAASTVGTATPAPAAIAEILDEVSDAPADAAVDATIDEVAEEADAAAPASDAPTKTADTDPTLQTSPTPEAPRVKKSAAETTTAPARPPVAAPRPEAGVVVPAQQPLPRTRPPAPGGPEAACQGRSGWMLQMCMSGQCMLAQNKSSAACATFDEIQRRNEARGRQVEAP